MLVGMPQPKASPWEPDMSALPPSAVLFQWGRARHLRPRTYFYDLAQHWRPLTQRARGQARAQELPRPALAGRRPGGLARARRLPDDEEGV